jgi:uncharacterized membrane protein HdeD (DUF308 family)
MNDYADIRRHPGWFIALGALLIVLGLIAVSASVATTIISVILFGWLLFIGGVFEAVHAFWVRPWSGLLLQLFVGVLSVIVGALMITNPHASAAALTLLLASFFIVGGIFRVMLTAHEHLPGRGWAIFSGAINILLGVLIWLKWPASAFWVIGLFIGIDLLFTGWWFVMLGTTARRLIPRPA